MWTAHVPTAPLRRATLLVALAVLAAACSLDGLSFRRDDRFSWVDPGDGDDVTLPFTLEWEMEDFDGFFGVFFDQTPMRPNVDLLSLVPDGDPCRRQPVCPDLDWLTDHEVFVTAQTSLEVTELTDRSGRGSERDPHEVTIVLLDETGTRTSETVFVRTFIVDRSEDAR